MDKIAFETHKWFYKFSERLNSIFYISKYYECFDCYISYKKQGCILNPQKIPPYGWSGKTSCKEEQDKRSQLQVARKDKLLKESILLDEMFVRCKALADAANIHKGYYWIKLKPSISFVLFNEPIPQTLLAYYNGNDKDHPTDSNWRLMESDDAVGFEELEKWQSIIVPEDI